MTSAFFLGMLLDPPRKLEVSKKSSGSNWKKTLFVPVLVYIIIINE